MNLIGTIGSLVFIAPLVTLGIMSILGLTPYRSKERLVQLVVATGQTITLVAAISMLMVFVRNYLQSGEIVPITVIHRHLFSFDHHAVDFVLQLDSLNIWFVVVASILSNIVGVFSRHYLHREPGFFRFFYLIVLFLNGVLIVFMGSAFPIIFMGWEFMGITSALLISFFTVRRETIDNALHAFWAYRVSDIGLLLGSFLVAAVLPTLSFGRHPNQLSLLPQELAVVVPLLFLFSAMGKSAQFPYCSWLPRAMEGPTSSSAIFYGGLSIHAGVFLLLRLRSEFEIPVGVLLAIGVVGAISCVYGALLSQIQSDVKSALAYASLSQVGIMFVEVSFGWRSLVVVHFIGHAFLRTYQILKCSSIIHQFKEFEDAHQHDVDRAKATLIPVFLTRQIRGWLFTTAFDLSIRAASGPSVAVSSLERISTLLQRGEERWLEVLANVGVRSKGRRGGKL